MKDKSITTSADHNGTMWVIWPFPCTVYYKIKTSTSSSSLNSSVTLHAPFTEHLLTLARSSISCEILEIAF